MKQYMIAMVFICGLMFVFGLGYAGLFAQDAGMDPVSAESIEQLTMLIENALKEKDVERLEEIKIRNQELVRENLSLTVQKCNTLLDEGIKNELSREREKGDINLKIARVMADIYQRAYENSYLLDKVDLFSRWGKEEKEKYLEAKKLYTQGEEDGTKYDYETASISYNKSLSLYQEIGYKEGKADCLQSLGEVYRLLDEYEKARERYEQGLAIYREIKARLGEADCLQSLGDVHGLLSEFEQSRERVEQGLAIYRQIKDRLGEANCLQILGNVNRMLDEYEKAQERLEQGLAIFREIKDRSGEANSLQSLGDVHMNLSEYEQALGSYEQALAIYRHIKGRLGEAQCLQGLGDVHRLLSEYEKAQERLEQCLAIFREIKARSGEAFCLKSLGDVHLSLSEYEKAQERLEQSLAICREIKDISSEAYALQSLGDVHLRLSENEKAREMYEQGLVIYREIEDRLGEANCIQSLGEVHRILSEFEKARERYEQGLVICREIKHRLGEANFLQNLGDVHLVLSEYEKALERYEQGLDIYREINDRLGEANCLQGLGDVHLRLSENKKARERYEQCLAIHREIKNRVGEAKCLQGLGNVHRMTSEYEKARREYEDAISIQKEIGDRSEMGRSYHWLGQTLESLKKYTAAQQNYIESISIIEEVWEEMKREEFKVPYLSSNIAPYEYLIGLLFKQGKAALAFSYVERSKARSFLYLLGNKRIDIKKGVPLNLVRQEEELRQKITGLTAQIMENEEKELARRSSTAQLNKELLQLKQSHSETLEKIKLLCPEYATLVSVNPLSPEDIQTLIRETGETVFLEYYTTPEAVYLWILDGKDIFPYKIDIDSESLAKKVREYYTMISTPGTFGVETLEFQAQELYNLLLKPTETHWAGKTRIGIIPHGILHYLPFEALMNKGKFLEEQDIRFFYLPSASVYKFCRDKNPLKKEQLIALGNPDGTLVFSGKEVEELKRLYPKDTEIFTGAEARETRVGYYGPYADILHFSCHGGYDAANPLYSALMLAPDSSADGRLEVQEIFQLNLKPAYLVTLSACETNVSTISPGDEMVGLSRAFMYAGTPSVLASLWKVDDYYTEKLMVNFYRALKDTDKITALHRARQEMMEKEGKRHPFYWAPFVLIGDFR